MSKLEDAAREFSDEAKKTRAYAPDGGDWDGCMETVGELFECEDVPEGETVERTCFAGVYFDVKVKIKCVDGYNEVTKIHDPFDALSTAPDGKDEVRDLQAKIQEALADTLAKDALKGFREYGCHEASLPSMDYLRFHYRQVLSHKALGKPTQEGECEDV